MLFGKPKGLLYLTRNGFMLYAYAFPAGLKFTFTLDSVKNLEVVSDQKLRDQIQNFVSTNKLHPLNLVIILSDEVYFTKTIKSQEPAKQQAEIKAFLH